MQMRLTNKRPHRLGPAEPAHTRNRKVHTNSLRLAVRCAVSSGPQSSHTPSPTSLEPVPTAYRCQAPSQTETSATTTPPQQSPAVFPMVSASAARTQPATPAPTPAQQPP